jgi:hypothetical protein
VEALRNHTYDLIITNTGEALDAVTSIGVHKYCPVLHPTHHESEAGVKVRHDIFSPGVTDQYRALCNLPDVLLACQSEWVQGHAQTQYPNKTEQCLVVPPLVPEMELLDFSTLPTERWGVGFIGPWEPRKNPEAYIYLAESIRAWPDQAALALKLRDIGFKSVAWQDLTFGIVAVHIGYKGEVAKDAPVKP